MLIMQENSNDYAEVYTLTKAAFAGMEHSEGNEQDLVERLRKSSAFIPELSLVAEEDGRVIGHKEYYPRFGYELASKYGITHPFEAPDDCVMVKILGDSGKSVTGAAVFRRNFIDWSDLIWAN